MPSHGIYVDPAGNAWVGGNDNTDHQILKLTSDRKFLLQIGHSGASEGSNSTTQPGRLAHREFNTTNNGLFVADGYHNKRVIVFDAGNGAYKRHWGAYGKKPDDTKLPHNNPESPQFGNPVHCARQTRDGLLYVCDRANNRIRIFRKSGEFVRQIVLESRTLGSGSAWDLIATEDPGQRYLLVADGSNGAHPGARKRRAHRLLRPQWPQRRRFPLGAQHRHRHAGKRLHLGGRYRQARAALPPRAIGARRCGRTGTCLRLDAAIS